MINPCNHVLIHIMHGTKIPNIMFNPCNHVLVPWTLTNRGTYRKLRCYSTSFFCSFYIESYTQISWSIHVTMFWYISYMALKSQTSCSILATMFWFPEHYEIEGLIQNLDVIQLSFFVSSTSSLIPKYHQSLYPCFGSLNMVESNELWETSYQVL